MKERLLVHLKKMGADPAPKKMVDILLAKIEAKVDDLIEKTVTQKAVGEAMVASLTPSQPPKA